MDSLLDPPEFHAHERYDPPNPADNVFDERPPARESDYYCLGVGKHDNLGEYPGKWKYCYARAGAGTSHLGIGRCRHHGGGNQRIENRYALLLNDSIGEKIAHFLNDPNPLDMQAELAAARALFQDYIQRHEQITSALLAWHASFDKRRRGLHDSPLYNIQAIMAALPDLRELPEDAAVDEVQELLESGVERARAQRMREAQIVGKDLADDLRVEKPMQILDVIHGARLLKIVNELVSSIIKHEREAYLSVFAVHALILAYAEETRKAVERYLNKQGVNDDGEGVKKVLGDIERAWRSVPALENSVPRLMAERVERERYLRGPGPKKAKKVRG